MRRRKVERKLRKNGRRLAKFRDELSLLEEELAFFNQEAEDKRVRALVSDNPSVERASRKMFRHVYRLRGRCDKARQKIERIEAEQNKLLDALNAL